MARSIAVLESETQATIARVRAQIAAIRERAADEGRAESAEERAQIDTLLRQANDAKRILDRERSDEIMRGQIEALVPASALPGGVHGMRLPNGQMASIGTQFTQKFEHWWKTTRHTRGQRWESPAVEIPVDAGLYAATLTSDPASGGDLVIPDTRPGIYPSITRRLVVADLFAQGTTDSNLVTYLVEQSFTNAADTVAEGAVKPESALTFDAISDPVRKIAHVLPVTEEMLEDVAQMRSYIDSRLRLGLSLTEEDQLLNGTTTAPDLVGVRNRTGLAADVARGTDTNADAIAKQIAAIQTTTGLAPDGIVMNPTNWLTILLAKTTTGEYLGEGPFVRPVAPTLWGLPVAITPAIEAGVALVGAFKTGAQIFRKGGVRVDSTNSHLDWFTKNLICVRAELRESLAVYRPSAFGEVVGLN